MNKNDVFSQKNKMFKKTLTALTFFFSVIALSQTQNFENIYNSTDQELSIGNLSIEKGKIHQNREITAKNSHRYLFDNITYPSSINYDNQDYLIPDTKYDIFDDVLVINPTNQSKRVFIELNKTSTKSFVLKNKKFVLIDFPDNKKWYCEENIVTTHFIFYIKYQKRRFETIEDNVSKILYRQESNFFVMKEDKITEVSSKNKIINLFPEFESEIKTYYKQFENLKKIDEIKFMENLFLKIKTLQK